MDDKRDGQGAYIWKDGSKWVGHFSNGQMHGIGMYYSDDGESWEVEYRNNKAV